jgi:hypothetical protein
MTRFQRAQAISTDSIYDISVSCIHEYSIHGLGYSILAGVREFRPPESLA